MLGSVAETIFRKSPIPVLTIGPVASGGRHQDGRFHNILLATDFENECRAAARYAVSLAQENQARLTLLHVLRTSRQANGRGPQPSAAEVLQKLTETVTQGGGTVVAGQKPSLNTANLQMRFSSLRKPAEWT